MRITVYDDSRADARRTMVGWFDRDSAEHFEPNPLECRGSGDDGVAGRQSLYRTSFGRWVLREDRVGTTSTEIGYRFLSPAQARTWLKDHGLAEIAARYFTPRRPGAPRRAGRPEVGGPVVVRLGEDLLNEVDNYAGARNVSRADAIRDLIKSALTESESLDALTASTG